MNGRRLAMVSLLLSTAVFSAHAQSDFLVTVTVTNKHFTPPKPVADVRVWLTFQDGTEHVTDDRQRTNEAGQTRLRVAPAAMERPLRVEITEAPGLMIYTPADGVLGDKVPATLQVVLLPKGSPAFMEPTQIEAMMNRLSSATRTIQKLKTKLNQAESEKPDFDVALEEWAAEHGLGYAELDQKLREWAQDIATHQEGKSLTLKAEAALGLRNYQEAAGLFKQAAGKSRSALQRDRERKEQALKETRKDLFEEVHLTTQSATSSQSGHLYEQATSDLDEVRKDAESEHANCPEDAGIRHLWAFASLMAFYSEWAQARWALSHQSHLEESARLLADVIAKSKAMLTQLSQADEQDYMAYLGGVVVVGTIYLSEISNSKTASELRTAAVENARVVVNSWDKAKDPGTWAFFEELYGLTLAAKAVRGFTDAQSSLAATMRGVDEAVNALSSTLDIFKAAGDLKDWAEVKTRIADLLSLEGQNSSIPREARNEVLSKAEADYQEALSQTDKSKDPVSWSILRAALGEVDGTRAMIGDPNHSAEQWARAVNALTEALQARPKEEDPTRWANVEHSLAVVLEREGEATPGEAGTALLDESARDYGEEGKVFSKQGFPQRWGRAQADRANVLLGEGARLKSERSPQLYAQSASAYEAALEVFTREAYPQRWADAKIGLARALALQGMLMQGDGARTMLREAAADFAAVVDLYPSEPGPLVGLITINHEYLHDFDQAYIWSKRLEEAQPNDGNKLNLTEAAMTDGKFAECMAALKGMDERKLTSEYAMIRQALLLSCAWAAGDRATAQQAARALAVAAPPTQAHEWRVSGDLMYLKDAPEFERGRATWTGLYQAIQDGDGKALSDSAQALAKLAVQ